MENAESKLKTYFYHTSHKRDQNQMSYSLILKVSNIK